MAEPASGVTASAKRRDTLGWIGRLGAPLLAFGVYLLLPAGGEGQLTEAGRAAVAIGVFMAALWMTEALPLPVTSLLPIVLFPLAGVLTLDEAVRPYADKVIFLFMGGFMLALAMEKWGLHKRIALMIVLIVGTRPARLVGGFMLASALLSMWVSNTATTVMMLPIGVSIIAITLERLRNAGHEFAFDETGAPRPDTGAGSLKFATCLMLGIAYGASIGGVGTIIGTPPNAFLVGFLEREMGVTIGFGQWMLVGVPVAAVFLLLAWLVLTKLLYPSRIEDIPGGRELIRQELRKLGPMSRGEWTVFVVFMLTALAWMLRQPLTQWEWLLAHAPGLARLDDAAIAIIAAVALFAIPVNARRGVFTLDWHTAVKLPWGVLLLFGGGLSLAGAIKATGVDAWIGQHVAAMGGAPTLLIVVLVIALVIFLTELTSNTATAATFLPILAGVAMGMDISPLLLVVPAAMAASFAFMMPVATPPNAIVFGSGHVTIGQMVRAGFVLNLLGVGVITVAAYTVVVWVLGGAM